MNEHPMNEHIWEYESTTGFRAGAGLVGYTVEARDGSIGKVDKHSDEVRAQYLVVDIGTWIFGRQVLLPAGTVTRIEETDRKIFVDRTKEQIKNAPEFDSGKHLGDKGVFEQIGRYYASSRI